MDTEVIDRYPHVFFTNAVTVYITYVWSSCKRRQWIARPNNTKRKDVSLCVRSFRAYFAMMRPSMPNNQAANYFNSLLYAIIRQSETMPLGGLETLS